MDFEGAFFDTSDFELVDKELGNGAFGRVYLVKRTTDGQLFAAKTINVQNIISGKEQNLLMRESSIMKRLNHPAVVKFYGINFHSFEDPTSLEPTILTEYLSNGSIRNILKKEQQGLADHDWNATKKYIILLGICSAMQYLHKKGILHRDLKPENILIDDDFYPRICDFGLSRCFHEAISKSMKLSMTGKIGTPLYMAPELFEDDSHFGHGIDVYSFAILAYEIVSGVEPFKENGKPINFINLMRKVQAGKRPFFVDSITKKMKKLLNRCWSYNIEDRPSFEEIFKMLSTDFTYLDEDVDEDEINNYLEYLKEGMDENTTKEKTKIEDQSNDNNKSNENKIKCQVEMIQEIIKYNDNIQKVHIKSINGNVLHLACKSGNLDLVKYIISLDQINITSRSIDF